jgi:hypothetical protein
VFRSVLDAEGNLGSFEEMPGLPEDQVDVTWGDGHLEGASWGIIGDFVYVTGQKVVHYAPILPDACDP